MSPQVLPLGMKSHCTSICHLLVQLFADLEVNNLGQSKAKANLLLSSRKQNLQVKFSPLCSQDQEDLDEARQISAFVRKRASGEFRVLEDELKDDIYAVQVQHSLHTMSYPDSRLDMSSKVVISCRVACLHPCATRDLWPDRTTTCPQDTKNKEKAFSCIMLFLTQLTGILGVFSA